MKIRFSYDGVDGEEEDEAMAMTNTIDLDVECFVRRLSLFFGPFHPSRTERCFFPYE